MKTKLEHGFISTLAKDGFLAAIEFSELRTLVSPIVYLCLTDEIHPTSVLKTMFNHIEDWDDFHTKAITAEELVERLSTIGMDIVTDASGDLQLYIGYHIQASAIRCAVAILSYKKGMSFEEVVSCMNETDIWADIACNGKRMNNDLPWSAGNLLVKWMYPGEDLFVSYSERAEAR